MRWHPRRFDWDEEPDPAYDPEEDYDLYAETCEDRAEYERENNY